MIFLFRKLGWLLRRRGREAELEEELRSHLDEETEEGQAAGLSREEAARRAHLELGNVTLLKEDTRATWSWRLWDELVRDVRSAAGLLSRDIRVSIVILCTLALGISANTAVFSTVHGVLLKPLPMPNADRLVLINETRLPEFPEFPTASGNFLAWQQQSASFENMAALVNQRLTLLEEGKPESLEGALVTASFFPTVGIKLVLGRVFSPDEDHPGKSDVVVVSARLWARRFRSDPNIIGRVVNIDSRLRSVIGVAAIDLEDTDLWVPMAFDVAAQDNHGGHDLITFGLLKRGTSIEAAATDLKGIARQLEASHPDTNQGWSVLLTPMRELVVGDVRPMLLLLWGVVSLVLLIMCANIANLLLIRSISRRRDVAIRLAIGATRLQIMRQLLAESVSLALVGGGAGILLAYGEIRLLNTFGGDVLPSTVHLQLIDWVFTAVISVVTGILFGLIPAIESTKPDLTESLKDGSRSASIGLRRRRLRSALVVAEVSLSLVLLIGAGLMVRSFLKLSFVNPGFNAENVLLAELTLPEKYPQPDDARRFIDRTLEEISTLPGVTAAAVSHVPPFRGGDVRGVLFEGQPAPAHDEFLTVSHAAVSPEYFDAMEIPLKRGRVFTKQDRAGSTRVTIVSETFAARFFPGEEAIGKRISPTVGTESFREIVGIVGDTKRYGLAAETMEQVYEPIDQIPFPYMTFVVKTSTNPMLLAQGIESRIQSVDRDQPVVALRPLHQMVEESKTPSRITMLCLAVFAGVALLIAATGLYGVIAYSVSQRAREIGLRMALGADRTHLLQLVLREGVFLTAVGLVVGVSGAYGLTRLLQAWLFQTSATDPATYVGISAILAVVSLLACYVPARRALGVDPVVALRSE